MTEKLKAPLKAAVEAVALCAVNTGDIYSKAFLPAIQKIARAQMEGEPIDRQETFAVYYLWSKTVYKREFREEGRNFPACETMAEADEARAYFGALVAENYADAIADELERQKAARPRVAIVLEGGIVSAVLTDMAGGLRVAVIDYSAGSDASGAVRLLKQDDGTEEPCLTYPETETERGPMLGRIFSLVRRVEMDGNE